MEDSCVEGKRDSSQRGGGLPPRLEGADVAGGLQHRRAGAGQVTATEPVVLSMLGSVLTTEGGLSTRLRFT